MRKLLHGLVATTAVAAPLALAAAPSHAVPATSAATFRTFENPAKPCCSPVVTRAEFNSIVQGMTVQQVIDRFDNHGRFSYRGYGSMGRTWTRTWSDGVVVDVGFRWNAQRERWVMSSKYAYHAG